MNRFSDSSEWDMSLRDPSPIASAHDLPASLQVRLRLTCALTIIVLSAGCMASREESTDILDHRHKLRSTVRLATTTSTRDSGLLDQLLPIFEAIQGCRVDVVAVGTGAALTLGEAGDVDVLLVHARKAEEEFMAHGHGTRHEPIMENHFTIVGPDKDPAAIRSQDAIEALKRIAQSQHRFLSRSDDSGTHQRELALWELAGGRPSWTGYIETGQAMGPTLIMADEMQGYVLTDQGTFLSFRDKIGLIPLLDAADNLTNPYAAIIVNPEKHEKINGPLADDLVDFLISEEAQRLIRDYQVSGQSLFHPTRLADAP